MAAVIFLYITGNTHSDNKMIPKISYKQRGILDGMWSRVYDMAYQNGIELRYISDESVPTCVLSSRKVSHVI